MTGARANPAQRKRFLELVGAGMGIPQASAEVGKSRTWGWRVFKGLGPSENLVTIERERRHPDPRAWDDLPDVAKECLADFATFSRVLFVRDVPPWREDAAQRIIDAVTDPNDRYLVLNAASGVGKSTLLLDAILWALAGGGSCDPAYGRSLRVMYGHGVYEKAVHGVELARRILESGSPYYDHRKKVQAEHSMVELFGRFKPTGDDPDVPWRQDQFTVASVGDAPTFNKEPSLQAISYGTTFLNERADLIVLDDVVTPKNVGDPDALEWLDQNPESRLEPGGALVLVGQRLAVVDLYGEVLERKWDPDEDDDPVPVYEHVVYPAHNEGTCDADKPGRSHRQWDLEDDGCLLDQKRLPWRKIQHEQVKPTFQAMFQQAPELSTALGIVEPAWINGGLDSAGLDAIGSLDRDRAFWEPVATDRNPLYYLTIDPAEESRHPNASWWALEVWGVDPTNRVRFLLYGTRLRGTYSDVLKYDPAIGQPVEDGHRSSGGFTGVLEDIVSRAASVGARLSALVVEDNKARGFLASSDFQKWHRERWPDLKLIRYQVNARNKNDGVSGVRALLADDYRNGRARWPWKSDVEALNYLRVKMAELTHFRPKTTDTVMAEWVGAVSVDEIIAAARRPPTTVVGLEHLPPYLQRQHIEVLVRR